MQWPAGRVCRGCVYRRDNVRIPFYHVPIPLVSPLSFSFPVIDFISRRDFVISSSTCTYFISSLRPHILDTFPPPSTPPSPPSSHPPFLPPPSHFAIPVVGTTSALRPIFAYIL